MASAHVEKVPTVRRSEFAAYLERAYFEMVVNASKSISQATDPDPEDIEKMASLIKAAIADLGGDNHAPAL